MDLDAALAQFDATETTLKRLETVWQRLIALVPAGIAFVGSAPEGVEYEDLRRSFDVLAEGLPAIDGWRITDAPWSLDEIAQGRYDAHDLSEVTAITSIEQGVNAPGEAIREYRFRFNRARRELVRQRAQDLVIEIETLLKSLVPGVERDNQPVDDPNWPLMTASIREVERLIGSSVSRTRAWGDLARHMAWGQNVDLLDIAEHDWPSVRKDIEESLYSEHEPMPVQVGDLAELVASRPTGAVTTALAWDSIEDEGFERLIFNIVSDAQGYENPQWLMQTRAPDRGRDISVQRVLSDPLSGVTRQRVIIQCRHQRSKSITPDDISKTLTLVKLWEPPPIDVLIFATSGRLTGDAVRWYEQHNEKRERPSIEPWVESHLESLLAQRPYLAGPLRPQT